MLTKACDGNISDACSNLKSLYVRQWNLPEENIDSAGISWQSADTIKRIKKLSNIVTTEYIDGFYSLVQFLEGNDIDTLRGSDTNDNMVRIMTKICNNGKGHYCKVLGDLYYQFGVGNGAFEYDHVKGVKFYEKGCELGDIGSCYEAGTAYTYGTTGTMYINMKGNSLSSDKVKAKKFYQKACKGKGFTDIYGVCEELK